RVAFPRTPHLYRRKQRLPRPLVLPQAKTIIAAIIHTLRPRAFASLLPLSRAGNEASKLPVRGIEAPPERAGTDSCQKLPLPPRALSPVLPRVRPICCQGASPERAGTDSCQKLPLSGHPVQG